MPLPSEIITLLNDKALKEGYTRGTEPDYDILPIVPPEQPLAHMQPIPIDTAVIDLPPIHTVDTIRGATSIIPINDEGTRGADERSETTERTGGDERTGGANVEELRGATVETRADIEDTNNAPLQESPASTPSPPTATVATPPRRSGRPTRVPPKYSDYALTATDYVFASKMSYKSALKYRPIEAIKAINTELQQLLTMKVWHPIHLSTLTIDERKAVIRSSMFLKDKYSSSGDFQLFKARLVAGGDMQNKLLYDELYSPTAATSSFFVLATLAAREQRLVEVVDVVGAYLNASLSSTGVIVHMRLDKDISALLIKLSPSSASYLDRNSCLVVQLDRALYGCVESSKMWYENLTANLCTYGFKPNPYDKCLLNYSGQSGSQLSILIHVDDILITSVSQSDIDHFKAFLRSVYPEIKTKAGPIVDYLGMQLNLTTPAEAIISMDYYVTDLIANCGITDKASTPARDTLFQLPIDAIPSEPTQSKWFHSHVAKMLYLSKRTYPECLGVVGFLSTRVNSCTNYDISKLSRLLSYVIKHPKQRLVLRTSSLPLRVYSLIDAAYGIHADGKSQSGNCTGIGDKDYYGATVLFGSTKQDRVVKSSFQAEVVAASDKAAEGLHLDHLLRAQGYTDMAPPILYQDNLSAMALIKKGSPTSIRSRHIEIRHFWLHEQQALGSLIIKHLPTADMYINVLTKPVQGSQFIHERNGLTRWDK